MTTHVTVKCNSSNPGKGAIVTDTNGNKTLLAPGQEVSIWISDTHGLLVEEGEVQEAAGTQMEVPPDPALADEITG